MKKSMIAVAAILIATSGILLALSPDTLSMVILFAMCALIAMGFVMGLMPCMQLSAGFKSARQSMEQALEVQTTEPWYAVFKLETPFRQTTLDELFALFREEAEQQREENTVISDIEDWINEDTLALRTWQGLVLQVPGILTGLGIIGTFVGLLSGIGGVTFSSVEAALESVELLLSGIEIAFYTSIAGVILSILFNLFNRILWNMLMREYGLFCEYFHRNVVPLAEKQMRTRRLQDMKEVQEKLDRMPRYFGETGAAAVRSGANEQVLMPQILAGMKKGEFTFYLQPRVDLHTRKIVAAEALVRWQSEKFGLLTAADFVPVLESNGYITRMDQYIWEEIFKTVRRWIDAGSRPVPVAINISKTDILAMDTAAFFERMLERYHVPPRSVNLEISRNAYVQSPSATLEVETALRQMGFQVAIDGFDGDYIALDMLERSNADALNLNLPRLVNKDQASLTAIYQQARKLKVEMMALGIENTEQITHLKKAGFTEGQGSYYYKPLSIQEFEELSEK